jgi:hypothetical protein
VPIAVGGDAARISVISWELLCIVSARETLYLRFDYAFVGAYACHRLVTPLSFHVDEHFSYTFPGYSEPAMREGEHD